MAFDPIQEDCHRLVLEALRRDNIPLTDGPAVERLMEQFTRNPAPLIVHDRDRAGHLIAKVVEAVDYRIPFIPDDAQAQGCLTCFLYSAMCIYLRLPFVTLPYLQNLQNPEGLKSYLS